MKVCDQSEYERQMWAWVRLDHLTPWRWCDRCRLPHNVGHSVTESGGSREGSLVVRHSSPDPLPFHDRKVAP